MARLLMHVAPMVDVYVIRVAANGEELEHSQENIAMVRSTLPSHSTTLIKTRQLSMQHYLRIGR
jgi:hypothetical protein